MVTKVQIEVQLNKAFDIESIRSYKTTHSYRIEVFIINNYNIDVLNIN